MRSGEKQRRRRFSVFSALVYSSWRTPLPDLEQDASLPLIIPGLQGVPYSADLGPFSLLVS